MARRPVCRRTLCRTGRRTHSEIRINPALCARQRVNPLIELSMQEVPMKRITAVMAGSGMAGVLGSVLAFAASPSPSFDATIALHAKKLLEDGRKIFRYD